MAGKTNQKQTRLRAGGLNRNAKAKGWLFMSPFLVGFIFFFCVVMANSLKFAFSYSTLGQSGLESTWNGFENFKYAFTVDPEFIKLLTSALSQMLFNIPVIIMFSLFIAVVLNRDLKGRAVFRAVFFIPVILSTGFIDKVDLSNTVMLFLSGAGGIDAGGVEGAAGGTASIAQLFSFENIQQFTLALHLDPGFTGYIFSAINNIVTLINQSGVQLLIFLGGLQSISPSIYEAAQVEGASGWECFWKITFPMISPMILVNLFYSIIDFFTRTSSPMMNYFDTMNFKKGLFGESTAMAWIYFVCVALILVAAGLIVNKFVFYQQKDR